MFFCIAAMTRTSSSKVSMVRFSRQLAVQGFWRRVMLDLVTTSSTWMVFWSAKPPVSSGISCVRGDGLRREDYIHRELRKSSGRIDDFERQLVVIISIQQCGRHKIHHTTPTPLCHQQQSLGMNNTNVTR